MLELFLAIYLFKRNSSPRDRWILPLALSVTAIEAIEVIMWLSNPLDFSETNLSTPCSNTNVSSTIAAYFILLSQPVLDGIFLSTSTSGHLKGKLMNIYWIIAFTVVFAAFGSFLFSYFQLGLNHLTIQEINDPNIIFSNKTCTYVGPYGHLLWQFSMTDLFIPNIVEASYFILSLSWFLYKPFKIGALFFIGLNGLLIANMIFFNGSKESYSVWCWQAIFIYLFFIFEPILLDTTSKDNSYKSK